MIFHRLGLINENQRGFTLVELIIAVAITGIIIGAATTTIFQVFSGNERTSNHMTAVKQVQNAGYWISHDAQMAQDVVPDTGDTGFPLTLTWIDWDGTVNEVTYTIVDSELKRSHYINGNTEVSIIAQYIDVTIDPDTGKPKTNCYLYKCAICGEKLATLTELEEHFASEHPSEELQYENGALTLTVTATLGTGTQEESETRVYEVIPRPS